MNRWDNLSLQEKNQLLGIYASKGYTDLASIISHYNTFQAGGTVSKVTPYGQWKYPGEVTTIPSNNITMKGVDYPVIGVSNTGDTKYMLPNMDYLFDGQYVTEYPVHKFQDGGPNDDKYSFLRREPEVAVADNTRYVRPISDVEIDRASGLPEGTTTMRRIISAKADRQQPVIKQDNATNETHKSINKEVKKAQVAKKVNDVANAVAAVTSIPATVVAPEVMTPVFALQGFNDATDVLSKEENLNTEDYGRLGLDALFMLPMFNTAGNYLRFNTNLGRALELSRELNKSIRNATRYGDIRVSESALQDPTKFYRFVEQPEVSTIEELGFNVTSGDAKTLSSAANRYRVNTLTHYNKTKTEGKRPGLLTKASSSHGNTSQASVGRLWNGSTNQSNNLFRRGVLEGDLYEGILASNGNRSVFNPTSLSDLSLGQRIGFRTGTMPIENLIYFEDLGNGMYRYNGQVLPEKRIYQIGNQEYIPTLEQAVQEAEDALCKK